MNNIPVYVGVMLAVLWGLFCLAMSIGLPILCVVALCMVVCR